MNPLGVALAIGTVGLLWWLTVPKTKFFSVGQAGGQDVAFWPKLAVGPAKQKLDQMIATPHPSVERVWIVEPRLASTPSTVSSALGTVLLIQGRGNLALVPKALLEANAGQGVMISEALPAEVAGLAPASQDLIGVLA